MEATAISAAASSSPPAKLFAGLISREIGEVALRHHLQRDTCAERGGDAKIASDGAEKSDRVASVGETDVKNRVTNDHLKSGLCGANPSVDKPPTKKSIFVCGVAQSITEYELRTYFKKFGTITDVFLMQDHSTNHPEEIGFITFDSEESACEVLKNQFHELNGKIVEVKKAVQDVDSYPRQNGNAYSDNYTSGTPNINLPQLGFVPYGPHARLYPVDGKSDGQLLPFSSACSSAFGGPYRPHSPMDISGIGYPHPYDIAAYSYAYSGYYGSMGYYGDWYTSPISIQNHPYSSHNNNILGSNVTMNFGGHTGGSGVAGSANDEACQTAANRSSRHDSQTSRQAN